MAIIGVHARGADMKKFLVASGGAVLLSAALWLPSLAQSEGTISASVTVQNIAVSVAPTSVDYNTVPFESSQSSNLATPAVTFTATNDGNVNEDFAVRGADATLSPGPGSWSIKATALDCVTPVLNEFRHSVTGTTGGDPEIFMDTAASTTPLAVAVGSASSKSFNSKIYTPCVGSAGLGQTASTSITVVATASP
jgi:hypothetical protein